MKHERTVKECTYQASTSAPPCTVLLDPDPLSAKRLSHTARWTWTDEECLFLALVILEQRMDEEVNRAKPTMHADTLAGMATICKYLGDVIGVDAKHVKTKHKQKRLTPKRKGA